MDLELAVNWRSGFSHWKARFAEPEHEMLVDQFLLNFDRTFNLVGAGHDRRSTIWVDIRPVLDPVLKLMRELKTLAALWSEQGREHRHPDRLVVVTDRDEDGTAQWFEHEGFHLITRAQIESLA